MEQYIWKLQKLETKNLLGVGGLTETKSRLIWMYMQREYENILMLRYPEGFENHPRWWYPKIYHKRAVGPSVIYFWISSPRMIFKPQGQSEHQNVRVFELYIHWYDTSEINLTVWYWISTTYGTCNKAFWWYNTAFISHFWLSLWYFSARKLYTQQAILINGVNSVIKRVSSNWFSIMWK